MRRNRFYQEDGRWYIDLPEWSGEKWELEMVMGANTLLELYSDNGDEVTLEFDYLPFEGADRLVLQEKYEGGGIYEVFSILGTKTEPVGSFTIWLCHVIEFVFNEIPPHLFIKKVN